MLNESFLQQLEACKAHLVDGQAGPRVDKPSEAMGGRCGHVERGRTGQNREKNRGWDSLGEGTGREDDREEEKGEEREVAS